MKFSIWPDNERPWNETLELATWCAASGFDGFWFADHFMEHTDDDVRCIGLEVTT